MAKILEYKCPCCGGAIAFDSGSQKIKCPYCDTEFEMETLSEFAEEQVTEDTDPDWRSEQVSQTEQRWEDDTFVTYTCQSCGGEIVADQNMASGSCPYCGNPVILPQQFEGMLRPDYMIPFRLNRKDAEKRLKDHLKGKYLLPAVFKNENRIKEIRGIYVPFWLYDCDAKADITCRATRTRFWRQGDYEYTETSHYLVSRSGMIGFERVPVDGSRKMDDTLMQSLEPYDYQDCTDFQTGYLAGYAADKYDQTAQECAPAANARMRNSTVAAFLNTISGYDTCVPEHTNIALSQGKISYALLPVWVLNTQYKGKIYTFAMNGQTGKFVGNLPTDKGKAVKLFMLVFCVAALLTLLITGLL